jgi:acetyltransferase-like isoleucine patch superfamily enzyme
MMVLPWRLRRALLQKAFGYKIHPDARIGWSIVAPAELTMGPRSRIGHLNMIRGMRSVEMGRDCEMGNLNWIYGIPESICGDDFAYSKLVFGEGAHIAHRHLIDCSGSVSLGMYSLVGGYGSQIMTHSIDIHTGLQGTRPIEIGSHCFVGTRCVVLGGSKLPDHSVLGAGSVLRSRYDQTLMLYAGVPAEPRKQLEPNSGIFTRSVARMEWR